MIRDEDPLIAHPDQAPVVVGIDGSPASEHATAIAFDEASRRGVHLVAVHTWSDAGYELPDEPWTEAQPEEDMLLAERLAGWQERYPDVTVRRVVCRDQPARRLLDGRRPPSWWSSAATDAAGSRACSSGRSVPRWCSPPGRR